MSAWTKIGSQELCIEPELVFIRLHGTFPLAEVEEVIRVLERVHRERGHLCLLFDGSGLSGLEPATRRRFISWLQHIHPAALANFGGGVMQRTLAYLLYNALRLIAKHVPTQTYVSTESEARGWLAEQRARILAAL